MPRHFRGQGVALPPGRDSVGLPARVFLYTIDQISVMIDVSTETLMDPNAGYLFFEGRSIGSKLNRLLLARNIAPSNEKPDWRVTEREFIRWMKLKGFRYYDRGAFQ